MFESVSPFMYPCQSRRIAVLPAPFPFRPLTVIIFDRTRKPILDRTPKLILNPRRGGLDAPYAQRH